MVNFNLRLPDDLHAAIKAAAEHDGRSAHGQMLWYLRQAVESPGTPDRPGGDPAASAPPRGNGHSSRS
ncbi:Arc family DNA-binding protein [Streptomyces sp. 4F14]|uniref:Arc family DNA-binding protein n=1 Tax=Streptomyces sp. 4F14 TaxID=3394380 RepID=UPI003A88A74D